MHVEKFSATRSRKLSEEVLNRFSNLGYNGVQKLLRNKDIKVNGKRTGKDMAVCVGDEIECYLQEAVHFDLVYEDENLLVCLKPRKIEVQSEGDADLISALKAQTHSELFAVHRLDRNTTGLVIFAKNNSAKKSLDRAIKAHKIEKYYLALVYGKMEKPSEHLVAYLYKDDKNSVVKISDKALPGYEKIETAYRVIESGEDSSLVEVNLLTGKTHQIRAHFAHIGHFVIGDEKYGDAEVNRKFKKHFQSLCANKLIFHFNKSDFLSYLDGKVIMLKENQVEL